VAGQELGAYQKVGRRGGIAWESRGIASIIGVLLSKDYTGYSSVMVMWREYRSGGKVLSRQYRGRPETKRGRYSPMEIRRDV
jgi:hypothetical protein